MIGLDTNVLARLFVDDDAVQAQLARKYVADNCTQTDPGFVDRVALCEMVWVLSSVHGYGRGDIARVIEALLVSRDITLEDEESVRATLRIYITNNVDFPDALIGQINRARGCTVTATFDRKAAKLDGFTRIS